MNCRKANYLQALRGAVWGGLVRRRGTVLVVAVWVVLASALHSGATITVVESWNCGEIDPGAADGGPTTITRSGSGNFDLTSVSGNGTYSSFVPGSGGSTLSLDAYNSTNGFTRATAPITATDNWGMEAQFFLRNFNSTPAFNIDGAAGGYSVYVDCVSPNNGNWRGLFGGVGWVGLAPAALHSWVSVALVRASGTATLYVNGSAVGSSSAVPMTPSGSLKLVARGYIDNVRVFTFGAGAFNPATDLLATPSNNGPAPVPALTTYALYRGGETEGATAGATVSSTPEASGRAGNAVASVSGVTYSSDVANNRRNSSTTLSYQFNGAGSLILSAIPLVANNDFGVQAWIKPTAATTGYKVLAYLGDGGSGGLGFLQNGTTLYGYAAGRILGPLTYSLTLNQWIDAAIVDINGTVHLYINGVDKGSVTSVVNLTTCGAAPKFTIAAVGYTGFIDSARVFEINPATFNPTNDLIYTAPPKGTVVLVK